MARNYAALYHEYLDEMADLSDAEFGRLARALLVYSSTGEFPALSGNERWFVRRVMAQEDRTQEGYEAAAAQRRANGANGGRPKKTGNNREEPGETEKTEWNRTEPGETGNNREEPKKPISKSISKSISSISPVGEIYNRAPAQTGYVSMSPPTVEDVAAYAKEKGLALDPAHFVDFYASKGWKVGREPMKDWKAACRNWVRQDRVYGRTGNAVQAKPTGQRQLDGDEVEAIRRMMEEQP